MTLSKSITFSPYTANFYHSKIYLSFMFFIFIKSSHFYYSAQTWNKFSFNPQNWLVQMFCLSLMAKGTPALWVRFRAKKAKSKKELGSTKKNKFKKSESVEREKNVRIRAFLSLCHITESPVPEVKAAWKSCPESPFLAVLH
jgi:hypothetical protein